METRKTNKSIPMDPNMIKDIHDLMLKHMRKTGNPISFGEATRIILQEGIKIKQRSGDDLKCPKLNTE